VEFLSDEWYLAANSALEGLDVGDVNIVVAHVSELRSHYIVVQDGTASVQSEAHLADVTLRQTSDIAEAIREGSLSALTAIQEGLIEVKGDVNLLVATSDVLKAVDEALSNL
jgi:putative sterol carrier protein